MTRAILLSMVVVALAGCRAEGAGKREIVVFAASSLADAMKSLEAQFEAAHPGVDVVLGFAGSQALRLQIESGAPADVFASANTDHLLALEQAGLTEPSRIIAHNELVVVVPAENPSRIEHLRDLPRAARLVIGTPQVPAGAYARAILERAEAAFGAGFRSRVLARVVSEELNVRMVLAKVSLGEADAGIVYRTDAAAAGGKVRVVPIPEEVGVTAAYRAAVVRGSREAELARAFVDLLCSESGQATLTRAGFLPAVTPR
jgi:molybdate transport system substrate-binding protein